MASNSRAEKAADKEAAAILASLSRAGEAAIEQTVEDTVKILRADPGLLYHLNALLHNEEWKAVLRASASAKPAEDEDAVDQDIQAKAGVKDELHPQHGVHVQAEDTMKARVQQARCHDTLEEDRVEEV